MALIAGGANQSAQDENGHTFSHFACASGHTDLLNISSSNKPRVEYSANEQSSLTEIDMVMTVAEIRSILH